MNAGSFKQLNLTPPQQEALQAMGYTAMTSVQAQSLPLILKGRDLWSVQHHMQAGWAHRTLRLHR